MSEDDDENPDLGVVLFQNHQWAVTDYGMESVKPGAPYHYHFSADRLLEPVGLRDGLYGWPRHMARKPWVDVDAFIEAFEKAIDIHCGRYLGTPDPDKLETSLIEALRFKRRAPEVNREP
jgi:hypothetical protein